MPAGHLLPTVVSAAKFAQPPPRRGHAWPAQAAVRGGRAQQHFVYMNMDAGARAGGSVAPPSAAAMSSLGPKKYGPLHDRGVAAARTPYASAAAVPAPPLSQPQPRKRPLLQSVSAAARGGLKVLLGCALAVGAMLSVPHMAAAADLSSTSTILDRLSSSGFFQAFSLIFVSEIGDKTFFIAGLLAMKTSRLVSFVGSISALAVMTLISVAIGQIFHNVPSTLFNGLPIDDYAAIAAFLFFGTQTLLNAYNSTEDNDGVEEELKDAEEAVEGQSAQATAIASILSCFTLVFAAEFGDRSFLSTIALAAAQNPVSVAVGAIAAHAAATLIAVAGGAYIAKYISEKVIGYVAGSLFILFALTTAFGIF